jgi:hypothetical protein
VLQLQACGPPGSGPDVAGDRSGGLPASQPAGRRPWGDAGCGRSASQREGAGWRHPAARRACGPLRGFRPLGCRRVAVAALARPPPPPLGLARPSAAGTGHAHGAAPQPAHGARPAPARRRPCAISCPRAPCGAAGWDGSGPEAGAGEGACRGVVAGLSGGGWALVRTSGVCFRLCLAAGAWFCLSWQPRGGLAPCWVVAGVACRDAGVGAGVRLVERGRERFPSCAAWVLGLRVLLSSGAGGFSFGARVFQR